MIVSGGKSLGFAAQALGETTPSLSNGYFYATNGLNLSGITATYGALYKAQPSIATVVDKIAASAARLTVKVWDNTPATGRVVDTASVFAKLVANPCPEMSPFNFYRWTVATYEVYGEAFWLKVRNGEGQVTGLLPMHPARTMVHRDMEGNVEYVFTLGVASAGILHAPETDVVAFLRYNPESLMRGMSRLEPLRTTLLNEDASRRATQSWWKRGARPSVILTHPGELSQGASDRLKASFDARHAGADNMGGTNVLEEGMNAQIIQLNAEEMQYIESRKLNMQEVCMVFDVPPPVVHILDHATFSNITEQMRSMYRDTMSPRLEDIESTIDRSLRSEFYAPGEREVEFDMSEVLRGDYETRVDKALAARQAGLVTGNEGRAIIGESLSEDPEMNKIYANAALVPLGANVAAQVATDGTLIPTPLTPAKSADLKGLTVRSIMGRISRFKANKPAVREQLVREHTDALVKFFTEQQDAVLAKAGQKDASVFDPAAWNGDLATLLLTLSNATSKAIGDGTAADLGGEYNPDDIADWIESDAEESAANINETTAAQIEGADGLDGIKALFAAYMIGRVVQIATSRVASVGGLASQVAARQSDARTKTWVVTSANARPSHEAMSGETVGLNETFSNGGNGPGDPSMGADEVAGCTCTLEFSKEG
ncbi:MAG TPA: phage portal protein [Chloroflexi bacterium]|nr:phage portal protein [Chloroflexota bacterium]